jgi:hypothetical protein
MNARRGPKRNLLDDLSTVQAANKEWWERTPMTYDWAGNSLAPGSLPSYAEQDRLSRAAHAHIATSLFIVIAVVSGVRPLRGGARWPSELHLAA